ncbi:MAG: XRE family transcriptional regulator [Eubacterium sp.]|nr:XRE family transcriptional regulator [Eubacterium sp.]
MGKKSTKENKNIYQITREALDLTRDQASEVLQFISADRIEKIENEKAMAHPDEVLTMAEGYRKPNLCNYYCSHECPIGEKYVPEVESKELSGIVLEMLASLNSMNKMKERLIEITADGMISDDELLDFITIQQELEKISLSVESLQLWMESTIANKQIDSAKIEKLKASCK